MTFGTRAANFLRMPSQDFRPIRTSSPLRKHLLLTAAVTVIALVGTIAVWLVRERAAAQPREMLLADGTMVILLNSTRVVPAEGFPQKREIQIQGDGTVFIRARQRDKPLTVRTGLLILTVDGESAFRALVSSERIGEQAEVLYGHVRAAKAYASQFSEPDMLVGGEMSMINKSVDLMEKERFDRTELTRWSEQVVTNAERRLRQ